MQRKRGVGGRESERGRVEDRKSERKKNEREEGVKGREEKSREEWMERKV